MECKLNKFDQEWADIYKPIAKLKWVIEGLQEITADEYITSYRSVYNICNELPPNDCNVVRLYKKYHEVYEAYICMTVLPSLIEKHGEFLLRELQQRWRNHKVMMRWLSHIFVYLNRYYANRKNLPTVHQVGIIFFRDMVYAKFNAKIIDFVIGLIEKERKGEQVDRALLKNMIDLIIKMDIGEQLKYYQQDFEATMLEDTGKHYSQKASSWILENSCPDYLVKVEKCLEKERERVFHYLHSTSEEKLVARVKLELLAVYKTQLLEKEDSGFLALLLGDKVEDLSRMFRLYLDLPEGLELGANIFKQNIASEGTMLVQQVETASSSLVVDIIKLHNKYMVYVNGCFENHDFFQTALKEAFEVFCNEDVAGTSFAELLSIFCDDMLKKGGAGEKLSDEEIEETSDKVAKLLVYVTDKDLFMEFYRKKLCHRLLLSMCASQEYEVCILSKLKQHHGFQFTWKIEKMITDIKLSKENHENFKKYLQDHRDMTTHGIDVNVVALNTICWPNFNSIELILPDEMLRCIDAFTGFYKTKSQDKKLTWVHSQGTCNIYGNFEAKTVELIMTMCQAAVVLLFNSDDKLSYSEIRTRLNINDDELVSLLCSLSCSKYKILKKTPDTEAVSSSDSFEYNSKFTDKMRRIRIPAPSQVDVAEERKRVVEEVDIDRRYAVDAAIIRTMKSRKVLSFQQLIAECIKYFSDLKAER